MFLNLLILRNFPRDPGSQFFPGLPVRAGQAAPPLPGPYVQVRDEFCRNAEFYRHLEEKDEHIRKSLNEPNFKFER